MRHSIRLSWLALAVVLVLVTLATALVALSVWAVLSICLSLFEIGVSQPWLT